MDEIDSIKDFAAVIDAFGGPQAFGEAIGVPPSHARTMKARNSIPADHWPNVVDAAASRHLAGVSFELLGRLRSQLAAVRSEAGVAS